MSAIIVIYICERAFCVLLIDFLLCYAMLNFSCVRACVRACVRTCVRASVRTLIPDGIRTIVQRAMIMYCVGQHDHVLCRTA